ncbi:MAG: type II toxin-antitoxin system HicA family toxin [Chitinophagaceae bacterium]|nr:type II toxin-antitoxin system HicA family toxin [Chitinophagaceae bacterium]
MKSSELHRIIRRAGWEHIRRAGWEHIRTDGSHYIYEKDGQTYPVPFHGAKEIGKGLRRKIFKEMNLKR